jgi:hypothetical protein
MSTQEPKCATCRDTGRIEKGPSLVGYGPCPDCAPAAGGVLPEPTREPVACFHDPTHAATGTLAVDHVCAPNARSEPVRWTPSAPEPDEWEGHECQRATCCHLNEERAENAEAERDQLKAQLEAVTLERDEARTSTVSVRLLDQSRAALAAALKRAEVAEAQVATDTAWINDWQRRAVEATKRAEEAEMRAAGGVLPAPTHDEVRARHEVALQVLRAEAERDQLKAQLESAEQGRALFKAAAVNARRERDEAREELRMLTHQRDVDNVSFQRARDTITKAVEAALAVRDATNAAALKRAEEAERAAEQFHEQVQSLGREWDKACIARDEAKDDLESEIANHLDCDTKHATAWTDLDEAVGLLRDVREWFVALGGEVQYPAALARLDVFLARFPVKP